MFRGMIALQLLILSLFVSIAYAQTGTTSEMFGLDQCLWFEEEDGSPSNVFCGKMKVTNGTFTNNGDGTFSLTTGGGGGSGDIEAVGTCTTGSCLTSGNTTLTGSITVVGTLRVGSNDVCQEDGTNCPASGSGDIESVGDVTSGAAFDGTQGTVLTFNNAGGDGTITYDNSTGNLDFITNVPFTLGSTAGVRIYGGSDGTFNFEGLSGATHTFYMDMFQATNIHFGSGTANNIQFDSLGALFGGTITPVTNDLSALGTTSLKWSDLFLASGAVINFNAGDLTLTHAANALTIAGGNVTVQGTTTLDGTLNMEDDRLVLPTNTTLPTPCREGEIQVDTDAPAGQQIYVCDGGSWTLQGDGLGGSLTDNDNIIYVGKWGSDANDGLTHNEAKLTIASANTASTSGDTILVYPGSYNETDIALKAGVNLVGVDRDSTIITGAPSAGTGIDDTNGILEPLGSNYIANISLIDTNNINSVFFTNAITLGTADQAYEINNVYIEGGYDGILTEAGVNNIDLIVRNSIIQSDFDPFGLWSDNGSSADIYNTTMISSVGRTSETEFERCLAVGTNPSGEGTNTTVRVFSSSCFVNGGSGDTINAGFWVGNSSTCASEAFIELYDTSIVVVGQSGDAAYGLYTRTGCPLGTIKMFGGSINVSGGSSNLIANGTSGPITIYNLSSLNTSVTGTVSYTNDLSGWSGIADPIVMGTTTRDVVIGAAQKNSSKLTIDGDADQIQITVQGHSTQTTAGTLLQVEKSDGTDLFSVSNASTTNVQGTLAVTTSGTSYIILRSPDATCSKCYPDNSDVFSCASVTCP